MSTLVSSSTAVVVTPSACSKRISPMTNWQTWLGSQLGTEVLLVPRASRRLFGVCGWLANGYYPISPLGGVPLPVPAVPHGVTW